ncbi:Rha family transcriptional regulator [Desulforamulus ruminis]|uniref:Rha family transcriptional regulator n=1 Tax=Desulforamulus ruminis TaxID=1564 RepID=UPI00235491F2|nr:Rha family transcriptional regulator [Desulforamulus ruminis]
MTNLQVINQNGLLLVDSREVAEITGKEHKNLLQDIRGYIAHFNRLKSQPVDSEHEYVRMARLMFDKTHGSVDAAIKDFFIESTYRDSKGETRPCYLITRKGCEMVANKMTGEKGVLFTAAYVTKFEEMEKCLKAPLQELSPQLQLLINMELKQKELEQAISETKGEVQGIREIVALNPNDWRKDSAALLSKMALKLGGYEHLKGIRAESYKLLDERFGVDLQCRLTNKRRRMADEGVCKSKRDKLNQLDVIADDKKLIEGYTAIIKEMAIKYGV